MRMINLTLDVLPPSANRIWRSARGINYLSREARDFYAYAASKWSTTIEWEFVAVRIYLVPKRKGIDVDNRIKPTLDALTKAHVWKDDSIVASVSCSLVEPNKERFPNGAVFVQIRPVANKYLPKEIVDERDYITEELRERLRESGDVRVED